MKRILCLLVMLLFICSTMPIIAAENTSSDLAELLKPFDTYQIEDSIFIEAKLTAEEKDFSHKNNSDYYYNSIFPDLILLNVGTGNEIIIPRIWIYYRTNKNALNIKNIEFSLYNSIYNFTIDNTNISALEKGTISEEALILIGEHSLDFMSDWLYVASLNKPIKVKLIGSTDYVEFDIPEAVIKTGMDLFSAYVAGNGKASTKDYTDTPVTKTAINKPVSPGASQLYHHDFTGTSFSIPTGWAITRDEVDGFNSTTKIRWESDDKKTYSNINYKASDVYQQTLQETGMSAKELGINRSMFDNSLMTKADYADIFGVSTSKIVYKKLGNYGYYSFDVTESDTWLGYEAVVTVKFFCNVSNGFMHIFTFSGDQSRFKDFEKLLSSVKYPQ